MAVIQDYTPPTIKLFLTCDIQDETLSAIKRDFALGAHEGYGPCARLEIDQRNDLHDLSSTEEPFLLADETTARDGAKATVWMVNNWAQQDTWEDETELVPDARGRAQNDRLPFAEKLRIFAYYAPILYVNLEIGNMSIRELLPCPYDPRAEQEAINGGLDWRLERPLDAYVVADSTSYETSTQEAEGTHIIRLGAPAAENSSLVLYRLHPEVARRLGLVPAWSPGSAWSLEHAKPEHRQEAQDVGLHLRSAMSFTQPWHWQPGDLA